MEGTQQIRIKHMVCGYCIEAVEKIFDDLQLKIDSIKLGEVIIADTVSEKKQKAIEKKLTEKGFSILKTPDEKLIDSIKAEINQMLRKPGDSINVKKSIFLSQQTGIPYYKLSKVFSRIEKVSIERFFIIQKVEIAKQLIEEGKLNIKEISAQLGYSSLQHLSNQFKKITGVSPIEFRMSLSKVENNLN